jgi:MYXO-CTERM domain-containing protein
MTDAVPGTVPTPRQFQGWFIDSLIVVGRVLFTGDTVSGLPRLTVDLQGSDVTADLLADAGKVLDFTVSDEVAGSVQSGSIRVTLDRDGSDDLLTLAADRTSSGWSALLAVAEPDLLAGRWTVTYEGVTDSGVVFLGTRVLTVRATDAVAPLITVSPSASAGSIVRLGPGEHLAVSVKETLLRRVTYAIEGMPGEPREMEFPYILPVAAVPEGASAVTFGASDRNGNVASVKVQVDRDTIRPQVTVLAPETIYAGVPFSLGIRVVERSAHTIRADVNGTVVELFGAAGGATLGQTRNLQVQAPDLGDLVINVRVNDTVGNQAIVVRQLTTVPPVADLRVASLRIETPATNVAREGQVFVATLQQVGGVAPLPVTVTFQGTRTTYATQATVPASGPVEVRWNATLPPGAQEVRVSVAGPAIFNETLPGNEEASLPVEVFLGRITIGPKVYAIRADTRGLPTTAVLTGTSKTYPLSLVQSGAGVAYQFSADGNRTVVWDPLKPVMTLPAEDADADAGDDEKDAPFPGLLMALGVLGLAVLAQRRRR